MTNIVIIAEKSDKNV